MQAGSFPHLQEKNPTFLDAQTSLPGPWEQGSREAGRHIAPFVSGFWALDLIIP